MEQKYLSSYIADNSNPYIVCGVRGCRIPFPHAVGVVGRSGPGNHEWKHVFADDYYSQRTNPGERKEAD